MIIKIISLVFTSYSVGMIAGWFWKCASLENTAKSSDYLNINGKKFVRFQ